ncbi:nucleolar MIF4G domain-containing protein 1-like [Eptesicus fuscus]|uniref:nucleolar MIF4G domain-containing protein 1-like n=1 Tax=Eptesicus fuscus TaxID=29078 RepID=UPI0024041F94|nr:nucleolar MIF4G domain-containing protein 1-like [Eptesicus fuscus]
MQEIHQRIHTEVRAPFLEATVRKFDDIYKKGSEGKECNNLFTIIAHLCDFHRVQSLLIFDILEKVTRNFAEKDMEWILLMLRNEDFLKIKDDVLSLEVNTEKQD